MNNQQTTLPQSQGLKPSKAKQSKLPWYYKPVYTSKNKVEIKLHPVYIMYLRMKIDVQVAGAKLYHFYKRLQANIKHTPTLVILLVAFLPVVLSALLILYLMYRNG